MPVKKPHVLKLTPINNFFLFCISTYILLVLMHYLYINVPCCANGRRILKSILFHLISPKGEIQASSSKAGDEARFCGKDMSRKCLLYFKHSKLLYIIYVRM